MLLLLVYEWHQRLRLQWVVRCFSTRPAKFMFAPVQGADPKELKSLLMKVKEERGKAGSKLNIQKTKILTSSPITSWQIDGETLETVRNFLFLGSKITAGGDCSHEIERCLLLGRKAMTNLDSKDIPSTEKWVKKMWYIYTVQTQPLKSMKQSRLQQHGCVWRLLY